MKVVYRRVKYLTNIKYTGADVTRNEKRNEMENGMEFS